MINWIKENGPKNGPKCEEKKVKKGFYQFFNMICANGDACDDDLMFVSASVSLCRATKCVS